MTTSTQRLMYGELLLTLLQREAQRPTDRPSTLVGAFHAARRDERVFGLCDRFERTIAQIYPPTLVWNGDYA